MNNPNGSSVLRPVVVATGIYTCVSAAHVIALLLQWPYLAALPLVLLLPALWVAGILRCGWLGKNDGSNSGMEKWVPILTVIVLTLTSMLMIKAHGAYDAWLHWNSLARYMSAPETFAYLHQPDSIWHADYPPGLPAFIGFLWRTLCGHPEWVPRSVSFLFYLALVLLLCQEAVKVTAFPYLWIAVLAVFALNFECLSQGLNQYADVPLSLMLLLVFMLFDRLALSRQPSLLYLIGFFLGGCAFYKNEGMMLAGCVLLVYANVWFRRGHAGWLLAGLLPLLAVVWIYKSYIPVGNDLVTNFSQDFWRGLLDPDKYRVIAIRTIRVIGGRFPLPLLLTIWAVWKLRRANFIWKSKILAALLLCFAGFIFTYLTTSYDIVWLTNTSFNRVLMQLVPSFIYFLIKSLNEAYTVNAAVAPGKPS